MKESLKKIRLVGYLGSLLNEILFFVYPVDKLQPINVLNTDNSKRIPGGNKIDLKREYVSMNKTH